MSEITTENLELSKKIQANLTLGAEGVITPKEGLYAELLPENITVDAIEAILEHDTNIIAAAAHAVGMIGVAAMKKDDTLDEVTCQLPTVAKDAFNFTFGRAQKVNAGAPGTDGGTRLKYGVTRVSADKYATGNRGQLSAVKGFLSDHAAARLDKSKK